MARLTYIVTDPMSARLLLPGQLRQMRERGFDVRLGCAPGTDVAHVARSEGVPITSLPLRREISPFADFRALIAITRWLATTRPHVVNAGTPKAGLLGMLAARILRVPVRIYTLHGLRLETARGLKRRVLATTERAASRSAHQVLSVGPSLARRYSELGLHGGPVRVLRSWSANGIDVDGLRLGSSGKRDTTRERLGIPLTAPVLGFVGRFTKDKGICDLLEVLDRVRAAGTDTRLVLLGAFESGDPLSADVAERVRSDPAIHWVGFERDTAPFYAAMDCLVFPSYREGLPLVPLEAAACGLPVAGYRATGTVDAVEADKTGTLVTVGDVAALAAAVDGYLADPSSARRHGAAGQRRVASSFSRSAVWRAIDENYRELIRRAGLGHILPETGDAPERRVS